VIVSPKGELDPVYRVDAGLTYLARNSEWFGRDQPFPGGRTSMNDPGADRVT